jgi:hypothetical protein
MAVRAMETRIEVLGVEHESTLRIIDMVGVIFNCRGKYEEAEAMH